jgi:hypothetical protein
MTFMVPGQAPLVLSEPIASSNARVVKDSRFNQTVLGATAS